MSRSIILFCLIFLASVGLVLFIGNDSNRYALTSAKGTIIDGNRFGISIGQSIEEAREILISKGFTETFTPSGLDEIGYEEIDRYIFSDSGWRRGNIWLEESDGVVTKIGWSYQFGAP